MSKIGLPMKRLIGLVAAMVVAGFPVAHAQTNAPVPAPGDDIDEAARVALAQGVAWLKAQGEKAIDGWVVGPGRVYKITGYSNVVVRYKKVMVEEPVYEYEDVVRFLHSTGGEAPRRVVERKPVRKIGTRSVERIVSDPAGPLTREQPIPIVERGGNTYWRFSSIGDAALATYALRQAGVPDTDPVMQRMAVNLQTYLDTYGLPDQTWNLAWLTAVYATTPGSTAAEWTQKLANRLLDGQITEGTARGLWGPLSIPTRLWAVYVHEYLALIAEAENAKLKLKKKPDSKALARAVEAAKDAVEQHKSWVDTEISRLALRFGAVEQRWTWDEHADPVVYFPGASALFYNQTAADLESTDIALFGLAVAAEQGRLPAQSWRPKPRSARSGPTQPGAAPAQLPPPEKAEAVLARAANALAALQPADGRWNECNFHQPVTDFNTFTSTLPVPVDPKSFPPLPSLVTPVSVAQGLAGLDEIGRALGRERMLSRFRTIYQRGTMSQQQELQTWLSNIQPKGGRRPRLTLADYDLYLTLARPLKGQPTNATDAAVDDAMIRMLVLGSQPDGSWGLFPNARFIPSSSRARREVLLPEVVKGGNQQLIDLKQAHIVDKNACPGYHPDSVPTPRDGAGYATAVAVLYLAGRVPDAPAVLAELTAHPDLVELRKDVETRLLRGPTAPKPPPPAQKPLPPPAPKSQAEKDVPGLPAITTETKPKPDETF